jgi:DNA-binding XRE family transcriptional regulator
MNGLKELRVELGISQKMLAKVIGVSDSTIRS